MWVYGKEEKTSTAKAKEKDKNECSKEWFFLSKEGFYVAWAKDERIV